MAGYLQLSGAAHELSIIFQQSFNRSNKVITFT